MRRFASRPLRALFASLAGASVAMLTLTIASAQEAESTTEVGGGVSSFGLGEWFGLGVRLALVVAVIWVAVAGMRWYVRRMHQGGRGGRLGALEVLETHALGPNRTLHLVRLGDRAVLVGATPERITQLMTVDDPEELRRLAERPEEAPTRALARGGVTSLVSSLAAGLVAINTRRRVMDDRMREQRAAQRALRGDTQTEAQPQASSTPRKARLAGLRSVLAGTTRRPASRATGAEQEPAAEGRQSLFERTLASIEAVEVRGAPSAAGLRARSGYGQTSTLPTAEANAGAGPSRDEQIADLQRAIAAARRNAG